MTTVIVPAHAQTSPDTDPGEPDPEPVICPAIVIGNVQSNPLTGANSFTSCGVTFNIFSNDPVTPIEITAITTSTLGPSVSVTNNGLGQATDSTGPQVTWIGSNLGLAPQDCASPSTVIPVDDITFTITATCIGAIDPVELTITLTAILASA